MAEAIIDSTDSTATVHGQPLGQYCSRVSITKILVSNCPLYRITPEHMYLNETIGSFIIWPTYFISPRH